MGKPCDKPDILAKTEDGFYEYLILKTYRLVKLFLTEILFFIQIYVRSWGNVTLFGDSNLSSKQLGGFEDSKSMHMSLTTMKYYVEIREMNYRKAKDFLESRIWSMVAFRRKIWWRFLEKKEFKIVSYTI